MNAENFKNVEFFEGEKPKSPEEAKNSENEEQELSERIKQEQQEAKEKFGDLINRVSERYKELPPETQKELISHNEEALNDAIELGTRKKFSKEKLEQLELSVILHDISKADDAPEKYANIPSYVLATHAETAAKEVPGILDDEYLKKKNIQGDPETIRQEVAKAISEHMGPHPGFMTGILNGVNAKLKEMGEKEIEHPKAKGEISKTLLAVDMKSLAGEGGRKKILSIRENDKFFIDIDLKTVAEYKKYGIELSQGEAALLSGFDSAEQAINMIEDEDDRKWITEAFEESKNKIYSFAGEEITFEKAFAKRDEFEKAVKRAQEAKDIEAAREQIEGIFKKAA